jgi:hypothetical protein
MGVVNWSIGRNVIGGGAPKRLLAPGECKGKLFDAVEWRGATLQPKKNPQKLKNIPNKIKVTHLFLKFVFRSIIIGMKKNRFEIFLREMPFWLIKTREKK